MYTYSEKSMILFVITLFVANRDAPFVLKGGARLLVKRKMFEMFLDESNII